MELTKEQLDIINSTGNIKINAVAGSGKTTTVIEYARTRPKTSKILYLAFNKRYDRKNSSTDNTNAVEEAKTPYKSAYQPWSSALDEELTTMFNEGVNAKDMAKHFGRSASAIRSRIQKLELEERY